MARAKSPCQGKSLFGKSNETLGGVPIFISFVKSKISLPRARFLWQEQNLLAKVKISLARATKPWGGTYFHLNCQEQNLLAKSKVSLPRAKFLCQEQNLLAKVKISLARAKK
ncbi:MAG: hypothetical protein GY739_11110, partial [Mesoflavibacter sp.]|nr:hypothetical protein [Mesoflavibacter sp.]